MYSSHSTTMRNRHRTHARIQRGGGGGAGGLDPPEKSQKYRVS